MKIKHIMLVIDGASVHVLLVIDLKWLHVNHLRPSVPNMDHLLLSFLRHKPCDVVVVGQDADKSSYALTSATPHA